MVKMQWANDLADLLFLPCWVEASTAGIPLYRKFGYYEVGSIEFGGDRRAKAMRRDAKTSPIGGGKS